VEGAAAHQATEGLTTYDVPIIMFCGAERELLQAGEHGEAPFHRHRGEIQDMGRAKASLGVIGLLVVSATSYADLVAYEGFDYQAGRDLLGTSGGFGFTGSWYARGYNANVFNVYDTAGGSLSYSLLPTSGGRVQASALTTFGQMGGIGRQLAAPMGGNGTTRYVSLLLRPEGTLNEGFLNGYFGLYVDGGDNLQPDVFFGKSGGGTMSKYVVENRGGEIWQVASNADVTLNQAALLVLKAEFAASGDTYTLYANPRLGGQEPLSGATRQGFEIGTISNLVIYSTGAFSIDEIRVGTTYADVVPEPSAMVLLATGTAALLAWPRRRRATSSRAAG